MRMKYVIFKAGLQVWPVIFPEHVVHSCVHIDIGMESPELAVPLSAGFFYLKGGRVITEGRSESMDLGPGWRDAGWIEAALGGGNVLHFLLDPP